MLVVKWWQVSRTEANLHSLLKETGNTALILQAELSCYLWSQVGPWAGLSHRLLPRCSCYCWSASEAAARVLCGRDGLSPLGCLFRWREGPQGAGREMCPRAFWGDPIAPWSELNKGSEKFQHWGTAIGKADAIESYARAFERPTFEQKELA